MDQGVSQAGMDAGRLPPDSTPGSPRRQAASDPTGLHAHAATEPLESTLNALAARARTFMFIAAACALAASVLATLLGVGLVDYALRLPAWIRTVALIAAIGFGAPLAWRWLRELSTFRPSTLDVALRLERTAAAQRAGLEGRLASAVELTRSARAGELSEPQRAMVDRLARQTRDAFRSLDAARVLMNPSRPRRAALGLGVALIPIAILALLTPSLLMTGAARTLAPWGGAQWPKRFQVADATTIRIHPIAAALPLRAELQRSPLAAGRADVAVVARVVRQGERTRETRFLMTSQGSTVAPARPADTPLDAEHQGEFYEKVLEPGGLDPGLVRAAVAPAGRREKATGAGTAPDTETIDFLDAAGLEALAAQHAGATRDQEESAYLEYWFQAGDDRTEPTRIVLGRPPELVRAVAVVTPPAYAASAAAPTLVRGVREAAPSGSSQATLGPVLSGSRIALMLAFSKPVFGRTDELLNTEAAPEPGSTEDVTLEGDDAQAWLGAFAPGLSLGADARIRVLASAWLVEGTLQRSGEATLVVRDRLGLESGDEVSLRLDVVDDRVPTALLVDPAADETVLASAVINIGGEARDDVSLAGVALERQVYSPEPGSESRSPTVAGERTDLVSRSPVEPEAADGVGNPPTNGQTQTPTALVPAQARLALSLDLGPLNLQPGQELWLTTRAWDSFPEPREATRSSPRKLRIISDTEFVEQLRFELSSVRQAAIKLEQDQGAAQDATSEATAAEEFRAARARQGQIAERLRAPGEILQRLTERVERNNLGDRQLSDLLGDARQAADDAGREARAASEALDQASQLAPRQPSQQRPTGNQPPAGQHTSEQASGEQANSQAPTNQQSNQQANQQAGSESASTPAQAQTSPPPNAGSEAESQAGAGQQSPSSEQQSSGQQSSGQQSPSGDQDAGQQSGEQASPTGSPPEASSDPAQAAAREAQARQQAARDQLARLIDMLDQGQDTWALRRQLEKLAADQRELAQRTAEASQRLEGQDAQELDAQEQAELNQLAQSQDELAQRTANTVDRLTERARESAASNPTQAEALQRAAQQARQGRAEQNQREAAEQTRQNRTRTANELQERAAQALEQALQALEQSQRQRDDALRRLAADIAQRLDRLIRVQEENIAALERFIGGWPATGLDQGMIILHRDSVSVADEIRTQRELAPVRRLIQDAATAQTEAIVALRATPLNSAGAMDAEEESLALLQEAKDAANKVEEQASERDIARRREELRRTYAALLARQTELAARVKPLQDLELSRRESLRVREMGAEQDTLRADAAAVRDTTEGLGEAALFTFVHDQLDSANSAAATGLKDGTVTRATVRAQATSIQLLESLVAALKDAASQRKDDFRDPAQGGSGGGGGGGSGQPDPLVPPLAELRLLRMLQQQTADLTRELGEAPGAAADELARVSQLQRDLERQAADLVRRVADQASQTPNAPNPPEGQPPENQPPEGQPAEPQEATAGPSTAENSPSSKPDSGVDQP
ncbi:MAG: hypothetical protein SFZ23_04260 [Planctomycetota bacterium]|nr:hypothetical protein [Planctomycetota bacterium]